MMYTPNIAIAGLNKQANTLLVTKVADSFKISLQLSFQTSPVGDNDIHCFFLQNYRKAHKNKNNINSYCKNKKIAS